MEGPFAQVPPDVVTRDVRAARTRLNLLSGDIALQSGISVDTVIHVLARDPDRPNRTVIDHDEPSPADINRLHAWARAALAEHDDPPLPSTYPSRPPEARPRTP